jgi:hypothetical protein
VYEPILLLSVTSLLGRNVQLSRNSSDSFSYRLTQAKEDGAHIVVDGKKVALGIPGRQPPQAGSAVPGIPLGRPGSPDEAAASVLL